MTNSGPDTSAQISGLSTQTLGYESLFERLKAGHLLITGNSRLARVLTNQYNQWRIDRGDRQWQSPAINAWNAWLDKLWDSATMQGAGGKSLAVPGSRQLLSLWESTLKHEPLAQQLLRPESLASQLRETRKLVVDWQLDLKDPAWFSGENENHAAFYQWNRAFEKRCKKDGWISPEDRPAQLCSALRDGLRPALGAIDLLGFDEFSPAQASLLSALINEGSSVCRLSIAARQDKAVLWKYRDTKHELRQMARWVRYWYEKEPGSSIAIVVPELQNRRQEVERQLEQTLCPASVPANQRAKPWNISMGVPLARVHMVETVFDLLQMLDKRIDIQAIGRVLRSPWLSGAGSERNERALLEKCLRDNYPRQLQLDELIYRAGEIKKRNHLGEELPSSEQVPQDWNCPVLSGILARLKRFESDSRGKRAASEWAESLDHLLMNLGWPLAEQKQPAADQDYEWQALQVWRECLGELATLDATVTRLGRHSAISQLRQICRERVFQPHTPSASIQVLGLYEVNGLRFDHLWVLGLHNDNWPASAKPNPFIPGKLQRKSDLPNSSPGRELEVARIITRRLLATSPDCTFSYPGQLDGEDVLPSPLLDIEGMDKQNQPPSWQGDDWPGIVAAADKPQTGPLQTPGQLVHPTATGGSSILKHQALCPFRAFASNRLGAEGLETPVDGISPVLHGSIVHRVLELFWGETKTQAALLQMEEDALAAKVREIVDQVTHDDRGLRQRPAFRSVEADRVHRHVIEFLELEKQREAFEVVGFEKEIHPEINGLPIRLFIDRIDRLASGEEIIIDYKTGLEDPKKWFGERPENPQLPLYAISAEKIPAAVVFGIIRDDGCHYKGVAMREGLFPGLPPKETKATRYLVDAGNDLENTIANWRRVLEHLVKDFQAGDAEVDPKNDLKTCGNSYCDLHSLCRVGELEQLQKTTGKRNRPESAS